MRQAVSILVAALMAATATGCESTQDKAKRVQAENARRMKIASTPLTVPKIDGRIKVVETAVLHGKDANAVVVTLKNTSSKAIADVPLALYVRNSAGKQVATNTTPGADHWLNHVPLIRAGQTISWVEDQFDSNPAAKTAKVRVGIGRTVDKPYPDAQLSKTHFFEDPVSGTSFSGKATSQAPVVQERLVVYSVGRQGGRIVTAGRGVVERLKPRGGNKSGFTVFFIGANPKSTTLSNLAPPVVSPTK